MYDLAERLAKPRAVQPKHIIDPVAFGLALVLSPLLITAFTFWMLFIPVFALVFGGPIYLIVATPTLLWYLRHYPAEPTRIGVLALFAVFALLALALIAARFTPYRDTAEGFAFLLSFGVMFGPIWAGFFAILYNKWRRDFYVAPQTY